MEEKNEGPEMENHWFVQVLIGWLLIGFLVWFSAWLISLFVDWVPMFHFSFFGLICPLVALAFVTANGTPQQPVKGA